MNKYPPYMNICRAMYFGIATTVATPVAADWYVPTEWQGEAVQVGSFKTRIESAYDFSA